MPHGPAQSATILIVDDDPGVRDLLFDLLSDKYNCLRATSGEEAIRLLRSEPPALLISDINMPGMSGLDLIPLVQAKSPDIVVMMISGNQTLDNAIEAIRAGAFDFLKKPFDLDHVEVAVRRAVSHHLLLVDKRTHDEELEVLVQERTKQLNYLAFYDSLTGLPNRVLFEERLAKALAAARNDHRVAVMIVTPDRFRDLRDTLGHGFGDQILKIFAERLAESYGDGLTVARFDAAEFGVVLPVVDGQSDAVAAVTKLFESLHKPFEIDSHDIFLTAAAGISVYPEDAEDGDTLIKNAGVALSHSRSKGPNSIQFFTADMHEQALHRLMLSNDLRHALDAGQLEVHYQPKVGMKKGDIVGLEALVRWRHPKLGMVSPAEFIPIAEETGSIIEIGEWVLRETCTQVKKWHDAGHPLHTAVNVSPVQFDIQLAETVGKVLSETGFSSRFLNLEVTESSIMQNAAFTVRTLKELKSLGIEISIDDFGTGYSSLGHLKDLPIDVLKIDKSFIDDVTTNQDDASLVMSIISLAHNLRLKVVAEGVETSGQLQLLNLLRCDEWQGFLFSKPLTATDFTELLTSGTSANV